MFIFAIKSRIDHAGLTVIMSLVVSTFAIQISIFNCIMCAPNEFDPMVVKLEFHKRFEVDRIDAVLAEEIKKKFLSLYKKLGTGK